MKRPAYVPPPPTHELWCKGCGHYPIRAGQHRDDCTAKPLEPKENDGDG